VQGGNYGQKAQNLFDLHKNSNSTTLHFLTKYIFILHNPSL